MTQVNDIEWSKVEQTVASKAFEIAYQREVDALISVVRDRAGDILEINDIWRLNDFLSARRHELDGKYDYEYSKLVFVFAELVRDGWLSLEELEGLEPTKITKIAALSRM